MVAGRCCGLRMKGPNSARSNHTATPVLLPLWREHVHHDSESGLCRGAPVCIADQLDHAPGAWSRTLGRNLHSDKASASPPGRHAA